MNFTAPTNTRTHSRKHFALQTACAEFLVSKPLYRQTYTSGLAGAPATRKHMNLFYAKLPLNSALYSTDGPINGLFWAAFHLRAERYEKKNTFPLCHILLNTLYRIYSWSTYHKNFVWVRVGDRKAYLLVRQRPKTGFSGVKRINVTKANTRLILKFCLSVMFPNYTANTWLS